VVKSEFVLQLLLLLHIEIEVKSFHCANNSTFYWINEQNESKK